MSEDKNDNDDKETKDTKDIFGNLILLRLKIYFYKIQLCEISNHVFRKSTSFKYRSIV